MQSHDAFERCYTYSTVENILEIAEQFIELNTKWESNGAWEVAGGSRGIALIAIEAGQAFTDATPEGWWDLQMTSHDWFLAIWDYATTLVKVALTTPSSWEVICGVNTGEIDAAREHLTKLAEVSIRKELT